MGRMRWLLGATLAVGLLAAISPDPPARAAEMDKVKVRLDWVIRGDHAMFFVAKEKGYFKAENIDLELIHKGNGSLNTATLVGTYQYDFGFADLPTVCVARAKGVPVVSLIVVNQRSPLALVALKGTGLHSPKDAEGKSVGINPATSTYLFYQALMAANQVNRKKVTETTVPPPSEAFLLTRKVQMIPGYIDAEIPELEARAGGPGSLEILLGSEYGYELLGSGVLTSEKMVKERPDLVRRFTRAYLRAFQDVIKNLHEGADILVKHNPDVAEKKEVMIKQLEADVRYTFTSDDTKEHGLGWNPPRKWQVTHDTLLRLKVSENPVQPLSALYSNEFLK